MTVRVIDIASVTCAVVVNTRSLLVSDVQAMTCAVAVNTRSVSVSDPISRSYRVFSVSPVIFDNTVPAGALLDDDGNPLRDDDGNFLIQDN